MPWTCHDYIAVFVRVAACGLHGRRRIFRVFACMPGAPRTSRGACCVHMGECACGWPTRKQRSAPWTASVARLQIKHRVAWLRGKAARIRVGGWRQVAASGSSIDAAVCAALLFASSVLRYVAAIVLSVLCLAAGRGSASAGGAFAGVHRPQLHRHCARKQFASHAHVHTRSRTWVVAATTRRPNH